MGCLRTDPSDLSHQLYSQPIQGALSIVPGGGGLHRHGWLVGGHGDGLYSILGGYDRLSGARLVGSGSRRRAGVALFSNA